MVSHLEELGGSGLAPRLTGRLRHWMDRSLAGVKARWQLEESLPSATAERILTTTRDHRGRWVAASDRALYYRRRELTRMPVSEEWIRLGWEQVARVLWDQNLERLTLFDLLPTVPRRTVLDLRTGASISQLARERIQATAIVRTRLQLPGPGTARVIGAAPSQGSVSLLTACDSQ